MVSSVSGVPLRLPGSICACLCDLDGVLTKTAVLHAAAWKEMFDEFLSRRAERTGEAFVPFDAVRDYDTYVDGRPRVAGAVAFLGSRGIDVPDGTPDDAPGAETIQALARRKDELLQVLIRERGVEAYPGSVAFVREARRLGFAMAVVSSSANTAAVVRACGLDDLFDVRIDGVVAAAEQLAGKPAPDTYLAAARRLQRAPREAAVFEDALAGIDAGRAGGFGMVVGVDRVGQRADLLRHGADVVVSDLAELIES